VSKFRHPHLTRGILYTSAGAFMVCRGVIEAPDAIGQAFGWRPLQEEDSSDVRTHDVIARTDLAADDARPS
jgi:hypothetical protein